MRGEQVKFADAEMLWTDFTRTREVRERAGWNLALSLLTVNDSQSFSREGAKSAKATTNFASFASSRDPWSEACLAAYQQRVAVQNFAY